MDIDAIVQYGEAIWMYKSLPDHLSLGVLLWMLYFQDLQDSKLCFNVVSVSVDKNVLFYPDNRCNYASMMWLNV